MAGRESISESSTIEGKHQINRGIQVCPLFVEEIATRIVSAASCHQKVHRDQAHLNYLLSQSLLNLNFQLLLPGIRNHSQNLRKVVKEKQLAHNFTVKDLGREVQREMIASIAGVARMIELLDLNSKHTGVSVPLSSSPGGTSNLSYKGKDTKKCEITESLNEIVGKNVRGMNSVESPCVKSIIPSQSEASLVQNTYIPRKN